MDNYNFMHNLVQGYWITTVVLKNTTDKKWYRSTHNYNLIDNNLGYLLL